MHTLKDITVYTVSYTKHRSLMLAGYIVLWIVCVLSVNRKLLVIKNTLQIEKGYVFFIAAISYCTDFRKKAKAHTSYKLTKYREASVDARDR